MTPDMKSKKQVKKMKGWFVEAAKETQLREIL